MLHPVLALILLYCGSVFAALDKRPQQVLDLQYGEILFHFYQDDYFTAITHLMAARERGQLPHHAREAELLLGGLQLSYGMRREAQRQFEQVLDQDRDRQIHDRVWYYLAKIAYERGDYPQAKTALQQLSGTATGAQAAEVALLVANTRMFMGENVAAAAALEAVRAPESVAEYLHINRAIALLRAGELEAGRELLDRVGRPGDGNGEVRAIRDRANLGLGYGLLQSGDAGAARRYLNRVRLNGPYAEAALLGAGWADIQRGDYASALTPWQELAQRTGFDAPVQEAQLAIPYAFEKMGDRARAVHFYKRAIDYFDAEEGSLAAAEAVVRSGALVDLLGQSLAGESGGWLQAVATPDDLPARQYLVDLLAGHPFQETLKQYRDLVFLDRLTRQRLEYIEVLRDMVVARRLAHAQRTPDIAARLQQNEATIAAQSWQELQHRLEAQQKERDPLGMASADEQRQWQQLDGMLARLEDMPDQPRRRELQQRVRWLQGVLYWQIQDDYDARVWKVRKELRALQAPLQQSQSAQERVAELLAGAQDGFHGYESRIGELQQRLVAVQAPVQLSLARAGEQLESLALQELEQRRQRLASYRNQARYALARNYDQLARQEEGAP